MARSARSTVSGRPSSLLKEPNGRDRRARGGEHLGEHVLGAGLALGAGQRDDPDVGQPRPASAGPARRARRRGRRRPRRAARCRARTAPRRPRRRARRRRSRGRRRARRRSRRRARRRSATRLSRKAGPSTVDPASSWTAVPPTTSAISGRVIGDHRARQLLAQHDAVVEGVHRAGDLLAGLVALAGDHDGVAGAARARRPARSPRGGRRPRAARRARRPGTASAPASTSARIAAGSSLRGLSSVTTSTSASRAAISPMIGRLPGSRSPPAPSTTTSRPVVSGRSAVQRGGHGVGLVGVVDDGEEVLAGVDLLQPPGHAARGTHRGGDRGGVEPGLAERRDRAQRVGDVEVPGQRDARGERTRRWARAR